MIVSDDNQTVGFAGLEACGADQLLRSVVVLPDQRGEGLGRAAVEAVLAHVEPGRDVFAKPGAPEMDFIFTVCDSAAGEACPVWIGYPMTAHWGVEDPAALTGSEVEIQRAFAQAARFLKNRITAFLSLPLASIDRLALETRLRQIGTMEGTTNGQGKTA